MTDSLDCAVIGAGVVGLAAARALARDGLDVVVLESAGTIGSEISARNSEVIHAGIYYPKDSLKAFHCLRGKHLLYDFVASHGIPHRRCGKLIVASDAGERDRLADIGARAEANGVDDLEWLDAAAVAALEPDLRCEAALLSPSSGLLDSHAFMLALQGDAEAAGAMVAFRAPVRSGRVTDKGVLLFLDDADETELLCQRVINAAGLDAPGVARSIEGFPAAHCPALHYAKGNYFAVSGRTPFRRLIYPIPEPGGLGVHLTLDLAGQARFGPDVEWVGERDYEVDPDRADRFYGAIRRYWPGLPDDALVPDYAGIRPKLSAPGEAARDFLIQGPATHGVSGLVNLFGIESPGLTAALSLADAVVASLKDVRGGLERGPAWLRRLLPDPG